MRIFTGSVLGEESFMVSPVVVGSNSTSRVDREDETNLEGSEDTDDTLVENAAEVANDNKVDEDPSVVVAEVANDNKLDEDDLSAVADVAKDKDETEEFISAESSLNTGDEANDTIERSDVTTMLDKKRAAEVTTKTVETILADSAVPTTSKEIISAGEDEADDDIFSDASSVASINLGKLPKGATIDNSSETDSEEDETPKPKPIPVRKGKSTKAHTSKAVSAVRSTSSSPVPSSNLSARSSRSSVASSPTPRSSRSSRSSRTAPASTIKTT